VISNFRQVLLYNFFEDSVVDLSRWRIVLNGVEGEVHAPNFDRDEARYAGVCSEVGIPLFRRRTDSILSLSVEASLCGNHQSEEKHVDR